MQPTGQSRLRTGQQKVGQGKEYVEAEREERVALLKEDGNCRRVQYQSKARSGRGVEAVWNGNLPKLMQQVEVA